MHYRITTMWHCHCLWRNVVYWATNLDLATADTSNSTPILRWRKNDLVSSNIVCPNIRSSPRDANWKEMGMREAEKRGKSPEKKRCQKFSYTPIFLEFRIYISSPLFPHSQDIILLFMRKEDNNLIFYDVVTFFQERE